ncbi:MAG: hypothetical protein R3D65_15025 [Zhengella sp.]|uniref:hypothetical protein n=1 Tax=Zhengella sp. TaxID=2282762 RepID=UPI001E045E6C|nr:hypothetical protein [Notoacmeibacter sp.]MCC0026642.1 hypothetical protein [Brucellaceae bacterium]
MSRVADAWGFPADRMVLAGYRLWMIKGMTITPDDLADFMTIHARAFSEDDRPLIADGLAGFIHALGHCASCPLAFHDNVTDGAAAPACHDEGLVLALVSALQYGMEDTAFLCATALACPRLAAPLAGAAGDCALRLKACGQWLSPVCRETVIGFIMAKARSGKPVTTVH